MSKDKGCSYNLKESNRNGISANSQGTENKTAFTDVSDAGLYAEALKTSLKGVLADFGFSTMKFLMNW